MNTEPSKIKRIHWNDDELSILKLELVKMYTDRGIPVELWKVNKRDHMTAQLSVFSDERVRYSIRENDIEQMQTMIDEHTHVEREATILAAVKKFMADHGMSPIAKCEVLAADVTAAQTLLADERDAHVATQETLAERDREIGRLTAEVGRLNAALSKTGAKPTAVAPAPAPAAMPLIDEDVKGIELLVAMIHPRPQMIAAIEKLVPGVKWLSEGDKPNVAANKAVDRHVLVQQGAIKTDVAAHMRRAATVYREVPGGPSAMIAAVQQFANEQLKAVA